MKHKRHIAIGILSLATVIALSTAGGQGAFNKTEFDDLMETNLKTARLILGGIIGGDLAKAQAQATVIANHARQLHDMTPPHEQQRISEFQANADSLGARANRLAADLKAGQGVAAAGEFGQMLGTCVGCHSVFRKQ